MRGEVETHNLRDRFWSRAYHLPIIKFHEEREMERINEPLAGMVYMFGNSNK
jgi:hypothetical protein